MARPQKNRKIKEPPVFSRFKPAGVKGKALDRIVLLIDEYEAIRLADNLGMSHEEAADEMEISRPTFTRLVEQARKKVSDMFIKGKMIVIEGGKVHFSKNLFKCRSCGNLFGVNISENMKQCPSCGSEELMNLAGGFGHGKCCL